MEQQIRFCTSADGTRIAYATMGEGREVELKGLSGPHLVFEVRWSDQKRGQ